MMAAGASSSPVRVRDTRPEDLAHIQSIYAHHVLNGVASFEEEPPDLAEITRRFEATRAGGFPFLTAESDDTSGIPSGIRGYAYAGPYRTRPAYRYSLENSVYVTPGSEGHGIGRELLDELIRRCTDLGYRQMIAVIGDSGHIVSIKLHEAFGFTHAGNIRSVGFKFGRWVDSVIMQRPLGEGDTTLPSGMPPE